MAAPAPLDSSPWHHRVQLPDPPSPGREAEYCVLETDGGPQQIRFGEGRIWQFQGLYDHVVRRMLRGSAPSAIAHLLDRAVRAAGGTPADLHVLDLNAGNGWVGECLHNLGVEQIIGVDPLPEAALAAERDHPGAYTDYLQMDMRRLSEAQRDQLMSYDFSALITVEPLSSEEPRPNSFTEAFNLLAPDGWVAFHLHEAAAEGARESRFARLVHRMIDGGALSVHTQQRYRHRFSTAGEAIFHIGVVARKLRDFDPCEPS